MTVVPFIRPSELRKATKADWREPAKKRNGWFFGASTSEANEAAYEAQARLTGCVTAYNRRRANNLWLNGRRNP